MPGLPPPPSLAALGDSQPLALFLDFDGTLVDIAPTPGGIKVPEGLSSGLERLSTTLGGRLALVSGRSLDDVASHLGPLAIARAGSHGADRRDAAGAAIGEQPASLPRDVLRDVADFAREHGFALEDKPHGAALHYRADPSLEERGLAFAEQIAASCGLAVKRGKCVIELVAPGADKAAAVRAFMHTAPFRGALPVFVGDDITDEDGMRAAQALGGFGVLVGDRLPTIAKYALASPVAVHHWLGL